jgi:ubiquinone/menaquinone biosynthesis C-methylase UbiE
MSPHLTVNDFERSRTSFSLPAVVDAMVAAVGAQRPRALLDIGCGYGGITATLRERLGAGEAHGVDLDPGVIAEAQRKGVVASRVDVGTEALPYEPGSFDVVTCFGMLDYLPWFDTAVAEVSRVLAPGGLAAVALPNLGGWHNRLALLFGYQPRDVEFCSLRAIGLAPYYQDELHKVPVGHIHTPTTRAFREFMDLMGFTAVSLTGLRPGNGQARPIRVLDAVLGRHPSTARRFLYIGRKSRPPTVPAGDGWWHRAQP